MSTQTAYQFTKDSERVAFDPDHRKKINYNISKYEAALKKGVKQYKDLNLAKKRWPEILQVKWFKIDQLPENRNPEIDKMIKIYQEN